MGRHFVALSVVIGLCSLTIPAAPTLGFEFESETSSPSTTTSSTAQVIQLGASGWVECLKMEMTASPTAGALTKLKVKLEKYTTCSYSHNMKSEIVTVSNCLAVVESAALVELSEVEFAEGRAKLNCKIKIEHPGGCLITIEEPTTALPEYAWEDINSTAGHWESLIKFRLENLKYTISSGCGTSGTNGEYLGSVPIDHVTIFPAM